MPGSPPFSYLNDSAAVPSHSWTQIFAHPPVPGLKDLLAMMAKVTYIQPDGVRQEIEVEDGYTVMEGAVNNDVAGIVAECGGACACATCHAYIDEAWVEKLPPMEDMEDCMLDSAYDRRENSRLTCQIEVTPELDGLVVRVAHNED